MGQKAILRAALGGLSALGPWHSCALAVPRVPLCISETKSGANPQSHADKDALIS